MKPAYARGTVKYQNIATGFWSIIADNGEKLRPVNMPEQLKFEDAKVQISYIDHDEEMSIFMWGTPVLITGFHTINV